MHQETYTTVFIALLFVKAPQNSKFNCPLTVKINCNIYGEYSTSVELDELQLHATLKQPNLRHFKLNQRSQLQNDSACLLPYKHFTVSKAFFLYVSTCKKLKNRKRWCLGIQN